MGIHTKQSDFKDHHFDFNGHELKLSRNVLAHGAEEFVLKEITDSLSWVAPSLLYMVPEFDVNNDPITNVDLILGSAGNAPQEGVYNRVHVVNASQYGATVTVKIATDNSVEFFEGVTEVIIKKGEEVTFSAIKNLNGQNIWVIKTKLKLRAYGKSTNSYTSYAHNANINIDNNDSTEIFELVDNNKIRFGKYGGYIINASVRYEWTGETTTGQFTPQLKLRLNGSSILYNSGGTTIEKTNGASEIIHITAYYNEFDENDYISFSLAGIEDGVRCAGLRVSVETEI